MSKTLVVYFSNFKSRAGEVAHKIALGVQGDLYEIKTTKLFYQGHLNRDGVHKESKVPIVHDIVDFSPYNPIYIVGETCGKYVIGPVRTWMEQNKTALVGHDKNFVYVIVGKNSKRALDSMKKIFGEPTDTLYVDKFEYPLDPQTLLSSNEQVSHKKEGFKAKIQHFIHS
ncbi:hypothetical protein EIN_114030 [Entamoeba invadens IP1]|uniref:Flavodoxin-like domain-containing protein n=1 Tax=Entamoeba invadens IP1 TaxID=370355 RepID=A0A0A1U3U2_ENTIV|nr:hypothetical protein EIN_114030 [Entamoeba invadens IP1]ELP86269.1 hypothetical protein EIN_114030 [Entamoeba invadens IP1]|eukprot:XP_004185615.1 hypothetical protein EIN_114030 [Entamoeba invadens IP1]